RISAGGPGWSSSVRWTRSRLRNSSDCRRSTEPPQGFVLAEQLETLEQAGRDLRPGDCDPDRLEGLPRRQLEPIREPPQRGFDFRGLKRVDRGELVPRGDDDGRVPVEQRG